MTTQAAGSTVYESILVNAPAERAFKVFTEEMASWWPKDHHILESELADMVVEPHAGGRIYDLGTDGSTCQWARVLAYEPPDRFVFTWDIGLDWKIETNLERTSEVEIRFVPDGENRTRVELEHRHIDRHGDGWEAMRDAVSSPGGWMAGLEQFAGYAAS